MPEQSEPLVLSMEPAAAFLIGRNPDPKRLPRDLAGELGARPVQLIRVPSQRVSSNHLLVLCGSGGVKVHDLNSRNGTLVHAPPLTALLAPADDLTLELANSPPGDPRVEGPCAADWTNERDFAAAVARSVNEWFRSLQLEVGVRTEGRRARRPVSGAFTLDSIARDAAEPAATADLGDRGFLLADDTHLHVEIPLGRTIEKSWSALLDKVQAFVGEQNTRYEQLHGPDDGFIVASRLMRDAHQQVAEAAGRGMRVMLLGPTGAGKDRLARRYHQLSRSHRGPYATLNCALLKENLLYAQLFGAKKGSFTGCVADLPGVVEAAHDGTLFLDEIGDMDPDVQKALLRFLDSRGEYQRLGDPRSRRVSVQIVCATNADLDDAQVRLGRFRDDLWYRLAVKVVRIPPLAERREDLIAYLRSRVLQGATPLRVYDALSPAALARVLDDPWPGNFRDLENFVERLPAVSVPQSIDEATCTAALREGRGAARMRGTGKQAPPAAPTSGDGTWPEVTAIASAAFVEDHGGIPKTWGQIQIYTEKYLKPVFIAQASGLGLADEISKGVNFSELARRLNIADGTTVKMHLQRYIDRFRRQRTAAEE